MSLDTDRLLTRKEAAAEFNVHVTSTTWWRWEDEEKEPHLTPVKALGCKSSRVRYWLSDLLRFFGCPTRKKVANA